MAGETVRLSHPKEAAPGGLCGPYHYECRPTDRIFGTYGGGAYEYLITWEKSGDFGGQAVYIPMEFLNRSQREIDRVGWLIYTTLEEVP